MFHINISQIVARCFLQALSTLIVTSVWAVVAFEGIAVADPAPNWKPNATLDFASKRFTSNNRANIHGLTPTDLDAAIKRGSKHVVSYPFEETITVPVSSLNFVYAEGPASPNMFSVFSPFRTYDEMYDWLGLHEFAEGQQAISPNYVPANPNAEKHRIGVTIIDKYGQDGLTFGCAACHAANLFGVKILGMTNRFSRANDFFVLAKSISNHTSVESYRNLFDPSPGDVQQFQHARKSLKKIATVRPSAVGLDTSISQVSLSLGKQSGIPEPTNVIPADSKPSVWWTMKYKTRWLSDGAMVAGNPVDTNILWNELGRGGNMAALEEWYEDPKTRQTLDDLTAYVFAAKPPKYDDFFPNTIDVPKARRGEKLFNKNCSKCHGRYEKGWSTRAEQYHERIATTQVRYFSRTPVMDVGTDSHRRRGMQSLAPRLNQLSISKRLGIIVEPQRGYVPPPLDGIWARWPYFHNNSVPTLFDVLSIEEKRPTTYIAGPAHNRETDFDAEKVGYPSGVKVPRSWRANRWQLFDTRVQGLGNAGHSDQILRLPDGTEKYSDAEKFQIIEYLKTL